MSGYTFDEDEPDVVPYKRARVTRDVLRRYPAVDTASAHASSVEKAYQQKLSEMETLMKAAQESLRVKEVECETIRSTCKIERQEMQLMLEEVRAQKQEAEKRAVYHMKKSEEASSTLNVIKTEHASIANSLRDTVETLRNENHQLSTELTTVRHEKSVLETRYHSLEAEMADTVKGLQANIDLLKEQMQRQEETVAQRCQREKDLVSKLTEAEDKLRMVDTAKYNMDIVPTLNENFERQALRAHELEMENVNLKQSLDGYKSIYENVQQLRAEKSILEADARDAQQLRKANKLLEVENAQLKMDQQEWAAYLETAEAAEFVSPQDLVYKLTRERNQAKAAAAHADILQHELRKKDEFMMKLEEHIDELKATIREKEKVHQMDQVDKKSLQNDKEFALRRVKAVEDQLKLYDLAEKKFADGSYDGQKAERISQLEAALQACQQELQTKTEQWLRQEAALQAHTTDTQPDPSSTTEPWSSSLQAFVTELSEEKLNALQEKETLQADNATLTAELALWKEKAALRARIVEHQETEPSSVSIDRQEETEERLLVPKTSPAFLEQTIRQSQLDGLRAENATLLKQLQVLQDQLQSGIEQTMDEELTITIPRATLKNMQDHDAQLEKTVASREKRIMRLHQVWEAKVKEFVGAVRSLLGYNMEIRADGAVRLESIYVEGSQFAFLFKSGDNDLGTLQVIGTDKEECMQTLQSSYEFFVLEQGNIPAFLSSATLELMDMVTQRPLSNDEEEMEEAEEAIEEDEAHDYDEEQDQDEDELEEYPSMEEEEEDEGEDDDDDEISNEGGDSPIMLD
ncbi:mitotic checkpoint protein-domain-containing protein [Radiomyces spectabilis]|uniref:mitotic checkpoint protein-domain-containing protein n=1 Tax=Radiomyces spectabilis TaxID=64574 RepID=UPI00221F9021|nr:mitotic checkpoint protein-domain-containing protein [Radiomyces spectabilis]KAI8384473.1 mitotic checkpoint protein-domain-containing protein [Radiomyces spectabilis]